MLRQGLVIVWPHVATALFRRTALWSVFVAALAGISATGAPANPHEHACGLPPRQAGSAAQLSGAGAGTLGQGADHRIVCRFHVIRRADGTGGIDESLILPFMQDLNYGYRETPFVFVREPGIVYVDNNTFYADFPTFASMVPMLNTYYQEGVINIFLVPSVQSGQFSASAWVGPPFTAGERGLLMAYSATGSPSNIATPPHEIGHIFDLLHPFETALGVECTSGVNCAIRGDLVCDTPASPIVSFVNTTATGVYFGNQAGPCAGDPPYNPNTRLYMDAGWPAGHILRDRFTTGQIDRMVDILFTLQPDLVGPQRPDVLVDCDGNSIDDVVEIIAGDKADENLDRVPDICQVFPQPGDLLVSGFSDVVTNRPRYFDGTTGDYRGEMWNGMPFTHQMRLGPDGLVYMTTLTIIQRLNLHTGRTEDNFIDGVLQGAGTFVDLLFEPDGNILVLDNGTSRIRRYDGVTGASLGVFATSLGSSPTYMEYGPDGNIYVVGNGTLGNTVQRVNGVTGTSMGAFVTAGSGGLTRGQGIIFHSDGLMYVTNGLTNNVLRFNAATGAFHDVFVPSGSGGLANPHSLRFGPDGNLYIASRDTHSVNRYHGSTGAFIDDFVAPASGGSPGTGGLNLPTGLLFVPGGGESVPTMESWALVGLALVLLVAGTILCRQGSRHGASAALTASSVFRGSTK